MPSDSSTTIRPAGHGDREAITACVHDAYSPFVEAIGRTPAPMLDDYAALIGQRRAWVAEHDGDVVGVIVMWAKPGHWYVDNIAVDPGRQGSGIGSMLLHEAERQARSAGFDEIRLYTNEAMVANQEYYPKRGYVETHRADDRGYRRVFYTRTLPDPE